MMATNPWTCLRTRVRTLCTSATHAAAAMVLCLSLTTTAASAAGREDPYLQASERINNDSPIKGCNVDDFIWAGGQMIEEADLVYELVLGNAVLNSSARPLLVEWAMFGDTEVELTSLLSIGDDELAAGVFMTGFLFVDQEELPWLDFEPTGAAIPFDPLVLAIANEQLADGDTDEHGLRLIGLALVQGIATGEAGTLDDVWMLLGEWDLGGGEPGGVSMMPIGIGELPVRDGDFQEVTPDDGGVTPVGIAVCTTLAGLAIGIMLLMLDRLGDCLYGTAGCIAAANQNRTRCWELCDNNKGVPPHCPHFTTLDPNDPADAACDQAWFDWYDCNDCCRDKLPDQVDDCRSTCGASGADPSYYDPCYQ